MAGGRVNPIILGDSSGWCLYDAREGRFLGPTFTNYPDASAYAREQGVRGPIPILRYGG